MFNKKNQFLKIITILGSKYKFNKYNSVLYPLNIDPGYSDTREGCQRNK